ncbi:MAG: hypothetical protein UU64_C0013G0013 [candidate division WWE3 bacterium GW2011_GWF2_41_45]|uniref:Uncharacterized protein n=3 Tax=Katanobacteria TaxID=422282 RepID=A0A354G2R8_UNCKA|nr:MAG: hypothetical protein UU55_C0014G0013 [candidate division WWE3 bacterium GW2011_GWC2_41_23]KKS09947.1 MAG: hypothetical protein UU64_C0013G0013 [candidate division WWE3 bacterium GW2011_GWF2_41_45]KKS11924.1 MAG: hypothetical protein UU68_C0008G0013 [candidate division WWE3 bacterium GW2011_GWF1_41_53]KKS19593.1 MAG: hypothetical protein UU79_C0015G0013 [candidate division WWE3 bacterium GW2011_GWE1_41_72]KKS28126.1 MAG: hypothetical protein UU86_C0011G0013 [candidate division WWE3 bacte
MKHLTPETQTQILSSLQTMPKAAELSFLLDDMSSGTYTQNADLTNTLEKVSQYSKDLAVLLNVPDSENIRDIVKEAQELVCNSDRIKVEMSYAPSKDFMSGVYEIFKSLGYKDFLLDFATVSDAGTGAHIYHNGNFIDISMFDLIKEKMQGFNFNTL